MRGMLVLYPPLFAALPVALLAAALPVNSYRAQGIKALDCDGPASVLLFAVPALLIYGAGAILLYRKRAVGAFILSPPSAVCSSSRLSAGMPLRRCANPTAHPRSRRAPDPALLSAAL